MLVSWLVLVLAQPGVAINVTEQDVDPDVACRVAGSMASAVEATHHVTAFARCVDEKTAASETINLRVFGGLTRLRVDAAHGQRAEFAELDLGREDGWPAALQPLAQRVFVPPQSPTQTESEVAPERRFPWPWVSLGATALITGVGTGFAISSVAARGDLDQAPPEEREALRSRINRDADIANVLFVTAAVGGVLTVVHFVLDAD